MINKRKMKLMKKHLGLLLVFAVAIANAQEKTNTEKAKDTIIKTEVVNVVTSYVPKITDAFKIKQKPTIKHTKETERKALDYKIFSVPVASTFIPQRGTMKKIDLGKRERLYPNYASIGMGNNIAPFAEIYVRQSEYYNSELGGSLRFLLNSDPVANTQLSSTFYNINVNLFYEQKERYYTWKAGLNAERSKYNWYGLPGNIPYTIATIENIEEEQVYNYYQAFGKIDFDESFIKNINGNVNFMSDGLSSSEFEFEALGNLEFPLDRIHRQLNDLNLGVYLNYFGGEFASTYVNDPLSNITSLKHGFLTAGLLPKYKFLMHDFLIQIGAKGYFSMDTQNSTNKFFVYPDVEISYPVVKEFANVFIGATGGLENNTYKKLSQENQYVSPTLTIAPTNEKYNAFAGVRGRFNSQFSYKVKASYADIENNPFFLLNPSKSNGTNSAGGNGFTFFGYEYGNSFNVVYDNMKRTTVFAEAAFELDKKVSLGANLEFNNFKLANIAHAWNTPKIRAEFFGTYKLDKWYAGSNIFFVGERKGIQYDLLPATTTNVVNLKSYIDVNFNGGYHFSDSFSVFLNLKNVLNNSYQQYTNFNVQGFQAMGGLTWKFDTLF